MTGRDAGGLEIDLSNMTAGRLSGAGVDEGRLGGDLARRFRSAHADVAAWRASGDLGLFDVVEDDGLARSVRAVASALDFPVDAVLVVGIGGSALGTRALGDALLGPGWNEGAAERRGLARLHVLDNPDPDALARLTAGLDLERTLVNVVSKSGSTPETMAQFLVLWDVLERTLGRERARRRVVATTSPAGGPLREIARRTGFRSLPVPENVGGRFSALSPAGLLPAAITGVDLDELLRGAREALARSASADLRRNPAGALATLLHSADVDSGAGVHVFMPYAERWRGLAYWIQQLWAESLGKALDRDGRRVESGPTPLPAFGATDQHSVLQLLMEGPRDKAVVFLARRSGAADVAVPERVFDHPALAPLAGRRLFDLLDWQRAATAEALRRARRMNMTIWVDRIDARSMGALLATFQVATLYAGALYGVDPLDQPGVELGKELSRSFMRRGGAGGARGRRWRV